MKYCDYAVVTDMQIKAAVELIGKRLKQRREDLGLKQENVANSAGLPLSHYGSIERAERSYRIDTLIKVLDALQLDFLETLTAAKSHGQKTDTVRRLAIEQLERVLDEGTDEDRQIALGSISRWYKALPKKRPE